MAFTDKQIDEQASRLAAVLPDTLRTLFMYLLEKKKENRWQQPNATGSAIVVEYASQGRKVPFSKKQQQKPAQRGRQNAKRLSDRLNTYYQKLDLQTADDKIYISIPLHKGTAGKDNYEPRLEPISVLYKDSPAMRNFRRVGTSVQALRYITEKIPLLNRIEETFVRWVDVGSAYKGKEFQRFLKELEKSDLLYRAVLGPTVDGVIYQPEGLRDVLSRRTVNHPEGKPGVKTYRLFHSMPLMNFTILYYAKKDDFFAKTDDIEVLYGFGIHSEFDPLDETSVFASRFPALCTEFRHLFNVLYSQKFSREIDIQRPELFGCEPAECDVIATFKEFPEAEIKKRFKACRPGSKIQVCLSAWHLLERGFFDAMGTALKNKVSVDIALWKKGTPFLTLRQNVIGRDPDYVNREITADIKALGALSSYPNLNVKWCKGDLGSVSVFWIDDLIYFSTYWIGKNVSEGPHFLVSASSQTGAEIIEQYEKMTAIFDQKP